MAATPWSYKESRGKRRTYTDAKYDARLRDLQYKTNWEDEELKQLQRHLEPLSLPERMEHLDILHQLPRNYVDYQPTNSKSRKRARTTHEKELKVTSNTEPWKFEIRHFMGNSARIPLAGMHDEIYNLRAVNDGISALMMRDGWCKSTISLIRHALHIPGLHLAMLLCPPTTQNPTERDHSKCSRTKCQALQVNLHTHTARHLHQECVWQCRSIRADEMKLDNTILEDDGIPRIVLPASGRLPSTLQVASRGNFIAVSHVWSHAFSYSPGENAMPSCQLERLRDFLNEFPGRRLSHQVWIDAFCIPERSSKPKAMSRIAKTFRLAEKIVVLDAKLLQSSCKVSPFVQAIRILSSDWVRRLWTLEEAILGCANGQMDKLHFRFSDGFVTLQRLLQELRSTQCPYSMSAVMGLERHLTFRLVVTDWRAWSPKHNSIGARFAQLARALEYRNTSKKVDELLCMASILGLPTNALLDAETPEDRAIAFYETIKTVPASILFCNGHRISKSPFRWALASFITPEDPRKLQTLSKTTSHFGLCESTGLHVRLSGIFFDFEPNETMFDFNRIWVRPDSMSLGPLGWGFACESPPSQSWSEIKKARRAGDSLVLIINPSCDHEGAVLRFLKNSKQIFHAEYLTRVHIRYVGKRHSVDATPIWRQGSSSEGEVEVENNADNTSSGAEEATNAPEKSRWPEIEGSFPAGSPEWERRSISARRTLKTSDLQKWIIT